MRCVVEQAGSLPLMAVLLFTITLFGPYRTTSPASGTWIQLLCGPTALPEHSTGQSVKSSLTIQLMTSQHIKMKVTHVGMVDGIEVCYSSEKRAGIVGQRVYGETIKDESRNLSSVRLSS